MEVFACSSKVTISSPGGPYAFNVPTTTAGSNTDVVTGATYASTSDGVNCVLTYSLRTTVPDAVYSGSFLTIDGTGKITVNKNEVNS